MGKNEKTKKDLLTLLDSRILISDGAMGTILQQKGYKGASDLLNLNPGSLESILNIHLEYLEAGSDIILTNTMGSNFLKLELSGKQGKILEINKNAVAAAREAAGLFLQKYPEKRIFIAGDLGPSGKILEPYGNTSISTITESYQKQLEILIDNGIDLVVIETMIDLNEALAALDAVKKTDPDILIACSLSFQANGMTVMGHSVRDFGKTLIASGCDIIGANCGIGSAAMVEITEKIRNSNPGARLWIKPNAGLPRVINGQTVFNETPEIMAANFQKMLPFHPDIAGACCGSSPDHIKNIARVLSPKTPDIR